MRGAAPLSMLVLATACTSTEADTPPDPIDVVQPPCIDVRPRRVEFRDVDMLTEPGATLVEVVSVSNDCAGDLQLNAITVDGTDPDPFSTAAPSTRVLGPDESVDIEVQFHPVEPTQSKARLLIVSNDPEAAETIVRLTGTAIGPRVRLSPAAIEAGAPYIGCTTPHRIEIHNTGNADLVVDDVRFATTSESEFSLDLGDLEPGPWTLAPYSDNVSGPWLDVFVDYRPLDLLGDEAVMVVSSNDPVHPELALEAAGTGTVFGVATDSFEQSRLRKTDVLFTLDRTGSLYDVNARLEDRFTVFTDALDELELDYHVAAVVADDGCIVGDEPFIDASFSASEAAATFADMADDNFAYAPYGSHNEAQSMLVEAALSTRNIGTGGCNSSFLRDEALLSLVHVADGPDQSVNSWAYYVALFRSLKPEPSLLRTNTVGGDVPGGCGSASPSTGYHEATIETGGVFRSVCDPDWTGHLEALAAAATPLATRFALSHVPVVPTLAVWVDGDSVTADWTYDAEDNVIIFGEDAVPGPGASIDVRYDRMPDCEE